MRDLVLAASLSAAAADVVRAGLAFEPPLLVGKGFFGNDDFVQINGSTILGASRAGILRPSAVSVNAISTDSGRSWGEWTGVPAAGNLIHDGAGRYHDLGLGVTPYVASPPLPWQLSSSHFESKRVGGEQAASASPVPDAPPRSDDPRAFWCRVHHRRDDAHAKRAGGAGRLHAGPVLRAAAQRHVREQQPVWRLPLHAVTAERGARRLCGRLDLSDGPAVLGRRAPLPRDGDVGGRVRLDGRRLELPLPIDHSERLVVAYLGGG